MQGCTQDGSGSEQRRVGLAAVTTSGAAPIAVRSSVRHVQKPATRRRRRRVLGGERETVLHAA